MGFALLCTKVQRILFARLGFCSRDHSFANLIAVEVQSLLGQLRLEDRLDFAQLLPRLL